MGCILNAIDDMMKERKEKGLCPRCGGKLGNKEHYTFDGCVCKKCYYDNSPQRVTDYSFGNGIFGGLYRRWSNNALV